MARSKATKSSSNAALPLRPASLEFVTPEAVLQRATKHYKDGKLDKAKELCEQLLDRHPTYVGALYQLGMVYIDKRAYARALPCMVQAAMYDPKDYKIRVNLAGIYLKLKANEVAAETYKEALALDPTVPETHYNLGKIYYEKREYELAQQSLAEAFRLRPSHVMARYYEGRCLENMGLLADAATAYHEVLELDPENQSAILSLGDFPDQFIKVDVMAVLDRMIKKRGRRGRPSISLPFARARALDKLGRHDEAFAAVVEANRAFTKTADYAPKPGKEEEVLAWARECPAIVRGPRPEEGDWPLSLFILGPSRSGKTTLERQIGAFQGVKLGFENNIVHNMIRRTNQRAGRLGMERFDELPVHLYGEFSDHYLRELRGKVGNAGIFTNTLPGLIAHVPRLIATIANTKFVFVVRDEWDQAIRIFFKHYANGNFYSYDMNDTIEFIKWYRTMEGIWAEKFPEHVLLVNYEDLVVDRDDVVARVAQFCGLEQPLPELPHVGDDRRCAEPYRDLLKSQLGAA